MRASSITQGRVGVQYRCRIFVGACGLLMLATLHARTLTLHADRLRAPEVEAIGIDLVVREGAEGMLRLDIRRLDAPTLGLADALAWQCMLSPAENGARTCAGPVRLGAANAGREAQLGVRVGRDRVALDLARGDATVRIALPFGDGDPVMLDLARIPAAWLRAPLARAWPNGELRDGRLDAGIVLESGGAVDGHYAIEDVTLNTSDGALAGESVTASGRLHVEDLSAEPHVVVDASLRHGRLRFGDVRFDLPDTPVAFALDVAAQGEEWLVNELSWRDAGTLEFGASGVWQPSRQDALRKLDVRIDRAVFPAAMQRYASSMAASQGWTGWQAKGGLSGEFTLDEGPQRIALAFDRFDLDDGGQFSIRGLDGTFDWSAHGDRPATVLRWTSLSAGALSLGAARASVRTRNGGIELASPFSIPLASGSLELKQLSFDPRITDGIAARAEIALRKIGYDSADGTIAAANVDAESTLEASGTLAQPRVQMQTRFHGGEFLYGPFYVKLPETAVESHLDARRAGSRWRIDRFDWNDPGVLEIAGHAEIAPEDARPVATIDVDLRHTALAPAIDRYARSWLASKGYNDLTASGSLSGAFRYGADGLERLAFSARGVDVDDGAGRFRFAGLDGGVDWSYGQEVPPTSLGCQSMELVRIPIDAASADLRSQDAAITLAHPIAIGVLGGQLRLERLSLQPRSPRGDRYAASFAIAGIDMARLCDALGWPRFGGNLSGGIPEVELSGDTVELHGGLDLYVFDGYLGVSGLTLERPFGVAPSLRADIHFENFDLEQVTSAFSFGGMSGRLDGKVRGLRLVDWSPVAFDAELRSDKGGRMSYKAVDDLTALGGGGGMSSSLQTMALKVFDTFGYRRLGIRCALTAEVCTMGGIEPAGATDSGGDSYTIVEGSGLPRIQIIGHRRKVAWPTLVERLVEATRGEGPVVR